MKQHPVRTADLVERERGRAYAGGVSNLLRIARFTRQLAPLYLVIILCSVGTAVAGLAAPFLVGSATDVIASAVQGKADAGSALTAALWLAAALLGAELLATLLSNVGGWFGDVMSNRMRTILSVRYYDKLLRLPQSWYDTELTGTIVARLNRSITEITGFAKMFSNTFATMIITTVAVLAISLWYAWPLAVLLLIVFPVYIWLTALTSKKWQRLEGEKNEQIDIASGRFAEVVGQIRVVKAFVRERSELTAFRERFESTDATTRAQSSHWHRMDALRRGVLNLVFFGIYAIIFERTVHGAFTLGQMVLLIQLMTMARQPVQMMSFVIDTAQHALAGSRDYFAVMETPVDQRADELLDAPASGRGHGSDGAAPAPAEVLEPVPGAQVVEFADVDFAYPDGDDVLHEISFAIAQGEKVALVGESGGGKSTIVNLLLGLYQAREGAVLVEGHDVAQVSLRALRSRIGVVFQDAALFSGTIRENIAYGRPDATDEEIREAARRANADSFIERFAGGYDQLIGERGLRLSGGQRQRIAVARAILEDAPILVLDEATSSLDTKAERQVQAGLDELMRGRTSLIIAHRLSTIAGVDRIITLREGRVDEIGSPAELAASGGIYAQLLALQDSGDTRKLKSFDITG